MISQGFHTILATLQGPGPWKGEFTVSRAAYTFYL